MGASVALGSTAGILSIRDVLDEIAERDLAADRSMIPGSTSIHALSRLLGAEVGNDEAATLGVYLAAQIRNLPRNRVAKTREIRIPTRSGPQARGHL